jgi:DNA-binding transcriptional LysR family regulator
VMSGARSANVWSFRAGTRTSSVAIEPQLSVNSFRVLAELASRGLGLARMPARYARPELALVQVLASFAPPARPLFAVYPSARHVSPALRALLDVLAEFFDSPPWLAR